MRIPLGILLAGALAALPAHGEDPDPVIDLPSLEVEAQRLENRQDLPMAGVDLVDLATSGSRLAGSLGEALSWQAGVSSSFYGAGASRPILRGMGGYRVGILDGGLGTGDLSASSPDHAVTLEPLFIRRVTIHRGAAALLHGGGAIGGAVDTEPDHLPPASMPEGADIHLGTVLETVNEGRTHFTRLGYRKGTLALRANLLDRTTEDYRIPGLARTPAYDRANRLRLPPNVQGQVAPNPVGHVPNTWTDTRVAALGGAWFRGATAIRAAYQHYASTYGVPVDGHTHGNPFGVPGVDAPSPLDGIRIDLRQDRISGDVNQAASFGFMDQVNLRLAGTRYRQTEWEGRFLSNDFRLDSADLEVEGRLSGPEWDAFLGGSLAFQRFINRNISYAAGRPDADRLRTESLEGALFALAARETGQTIWHAGVRLDMSHTRRTDRSGLSHTDAVPSLVLEAVHPLGGGWRAVVALAHSGRLPSADERTIEAPHGATGVYQLPNPDLDPEIAESAELRLAHRTPRTTVSLNAFHRRFDGFIFLENQGYEVDGLTAYALVQRDARFSGGELEAEWIPFSEHGRQLILRLHADYVRATDTERKEPLPRMPPARIGGSARITWQSGTAGILFLHAMEQDRVPQRVFGTLAYQSPSDAYTLVTLEYEQAFSIGQTTGHLGIRISNLLDEEARQHTSFLKDVAPLPGRSLQLSLGIDF